MQAVESNSTDVTDHRHSEQARREDRKQFEQLVDTVEEYAIFTLDTEGRVQTWNPGAEQIKGYEAEEIAGEHIATFYTSADCEKGLPEQNLSAAASDGTVHDEGWRVRADGSLFWADVTIAAIRDDSGSLQGFATIVQDITEQRERRQELRRYATLFEKSKDVNMIVEPDGTLQYFTPSVTNVFGYDQEALVGESGLDYIHPDDYAEAKQEFRKALEIPGYEPELEFRFKHADGSWVVVEALARDLQNNPDIGGLVVYTRDVTDRKDRQEKLERYASIVDAVDEPVYALDTRGRFTFVNDAMIEHLGYDENELLGEHVSICMDDEKIDRSATKIKELYREHPGETISLEYDVQTKDGRRIPSENRISLLTDSDGQVRGSAGVLWDITERKEREREREAHIARQESVATLGKLALEDPDLDELMAEITDLVADSLAADYCELLDHDSDAEQLSVRSNAGPEAETVGDEIGSTVDSNGLVGPALATDHPIVVEDIDSETHSTPLTDRGFTSGISVAITRCDEPWGILGVYDTERREFTDQDVTFVQSVAHILTTAINRYSQQQALRQQSEELTALNSLNGVVRNITETIITQSTREEIEQAVCDQLAAADSYEFAWLAGVDTSAEELIPRATAGTRGYTDDITISLAPDHQSSQGPGARSVREQKIQVIQNVFSDPVFEPWRDTAEEYGFKSVASIPIVHKGTVFGFLAVYADRKNAFEAAERSVISRLGEVIGHAIAAVERKRALVSEEVTELTFQVRNMLQTFDIRFDLEGTVSFDEVVPIQNGEFLLYGSATAETRDAMKQLQQTIPNWKAISFHSETGDTRFELKLSEQEILSTLVSLGGRLKRAEFDDGDYQLTVQLATGSHVGHLTEALDKKYDDIELVTRRQVTREPDREKSVGSVVDELLTERQQTTLRAAYHAGYFEWPRDSSGNDVAESLDIATSTLHYHLRRAEKKVVESVLTTE